MSQDITAMIRTTDQAWTARHAAPGPEASTAVITIPAGSATATTVCGKPFLRIDLKAVTGGMPADCLNRHVMIPEAHVLSGATPETFAPAAQNARRELSEWRAAALAAASRG